MTRWPGRLEWVEPPGEPNPSCWMWRTIPMERETLERGAGRGLLQEGRRWSFGALSDKEVQAVLPGLAKRATRRK